MHHLRWHRQIFRQIFLTASATFIVSGGAACAKADPEIKHAPPLGLTVGQALAKFGPAARQKLKAEFEAKHIAYPPSYLTFVGLKTERQVCLFAGQEKPVLIARFPLVTFSGALGPKLREGDGQIPEGVYAIDGLAASFRLALMVGYPNKFDRQKAELDKRTRLGGEILIHNGVHSSGCLVLSMDDMSQLFTAAHDVGTSNTVLIIAPCNLAAKSADVDCKAQPAWLPELYNSLRERLRTLPGL
jgi:hypothetical protein